MELSSWDIVQVQRINNVKWRSGPRGAAVSPHGNWVVVGFVENEAMIAKDGTVIRIPVNDIKRVGSYSKEDVLAHLKTIGKPDKTIDMVDSVAREFTWDHQRARSFLLRYNLPEKAQNEAHKQKIIARVHKLTQGGFGG